MPLITEARKAAEREDPRLPYHTGAYDDTWEVVAAAHDAEAAGLRPRAA